MIRAVAGHVSIRAGILAESARIQFLESLSNRGQVIFVAVQPIAFLLISLSGPGSTGTVDSANVAIGVVLTAFWNATVWGASGILRRDRAQGTLAPIVTSVIDSKYVVLGRGVGGSANALAGIAVSTMVALVALGRPVAVHDIGWTVVGLLACVASGACVGLLIGTVFFVTRYGPQISGALTYPVFLFGGLLISPAIFPVPVRWLSLGLSLNWLRRFMSDAVAGHVGGTAVRDLGTALLLTLAYALIGSLLFKRALGRARRDASLDLF